MEDYKLLLVNNEGNISNKIAQLNICTAFVNKKYDLNMKYSDRIFIHKGMYAVRKLSLVE